MEGKMRMKQTKNFYYSIWQDALCNIKKHNPKDYKWIALVFISMGNALNLLSISLLLNLLLNIPTLIFDQTSFFLESRLLIV